MAKKILVVDDEPHVLSVVKRRLEGAGYEVTTAEEGHAGLRKARTEHPDLIVLDLILPNMNGYQICAMLKGDKSYRHIPIMMLTVRSQEKDVAEGMRVGANAYMTKPYDADAFLARVAELLAETDRARTTEQEQEAEKVKEVTDHLKWKQENL
jgi:two-component system, OmpR family, alkaline phosphatase synthesis response regulator PhoP